MIKFFALDFGTSNTVLSSWNDVEKQGEAIHLPGYGKEYYQGGKFVSVIPSLIHYTADNRQWIGNQVIEKGLYDSPRTFRWMKRYISHRSPIKISLDGRSITPYTAGKDFISTILTVASQEFRLLNDEMAVTIPVEAFEHYENWLSSTLETSGINRFRFIDEPSAAALGYGAHILPGNVYLLFDFGGGTLHASVILIEAESNGSGNRRCRVLGKAGRDIGGTSIDQWIFEDVLRKNNFEDYDDLIRPISTNILCESERIKEQLSTQDHASFLVKQPITGLEIAAEYSRSEFEELLEAHDLYANINQTIQAAMNAAREHGYDQDKIISAIMVGGTSQIPSVQRTVRQIFGKDRVFSHRPLDAIACGAAAFISGIDFYDYIQHDYAIRYTSTPKNEYEYRTIVTKHTPYPTQDLIEKIIIKASYTGQKRLGINLFEIGRNFQQRLSPSVEIVFDLTGAARIMQISPHEEEIRSLFWMNEQSPTFLVAEPAGVKGEDRFEVEFSIDSNKRLIISARDLVTGNLVLDKHPVVRLT